MDIEVNDLTAGYGSGIVIAQVSFRVERGAALAIVGRNGMGKTTLARALLGYLPVKSGSIKIGAQEVAEWPTHEIIRLGVAYGPQEAAIFGDLTVGENLRLGALNTRNYTERQEHVLASFPVLAKRLQQKAGTLSGGEQKMLILARALIPEPAVLVLDEVTEGLQPSVVSTVRNVLQAERKRRDLTLILIEQNIELALAVADKVIVLQRGEVVFDALTASSGVRDELAKRLSV